MCPLHDPFILDLQQVLLSCVWNLVVIGGEDIFPDDPSITGCAETMPKSVSQVHGLSRIIVHM